MDTLQGDFQYAKPVGGVNEPQKKKKYGRKKNDFKPTRVPEFTEAAYTGNFKVEN